METKFLQLFAEESDPNQNPDVGYAKPVEEAEKAGQGKKEAKYTDADVDRIINRKFAEWEAKQQKKVDEAARLAEMSAQQKAEYERDQLQKELDALREKDTLSGMMKSARKMLSDQSVSVDDELLELLVSTDADKTKAAVNKFADAFSRAVKSAVEDKLKGVSPRRSVPESGVSREQILAVKDRTERQRLISENMNLFQKGQ